MPRKKQKKGEERRKGQEEQMKSSPDLKFRKPQHNKNKMIRARQASGKSEEGKAIWEIE